jgi:3-hydroxyacyl-[acyl-carrier-protein] dehydratase
MTEMDNCEVRKYLPHRYPFLLVDKVISVTPGETLIAIKNVTSNEPYFTGHFPGRAIMPGVLMIEALAQACGILAYKSLNMYPADPTEKDLFFLVGIDEVRYKRIVVPGDQLKLHVKFIKARLDLWKFEGQVTVDDEMACTALLMIKKAAD